MLLPTNAFPDIDTPETGQFSSDSMWSRNILLEIIFHYNNFCIKMTLEFR
jgi:hypothetical protein